MENIHPKRNWDLFKHALPALLTPTVLLEYLQVHRCVCFLQPFPTGSDFCRGCTGTDNINTMNSVQVNIPAESGDMGVLANHVPSIEQLKPGLVEIIEESGGSKRFFRMWPN